MVALEQTAVSYLRRNLNPVFQDQLLLFDRSVLNNVLLPLVIARAVVGRHAILLSGNPSPTWCEDCAWDIAALFHAFYQVG